MRATCRLEWETGGEDEVVAAQKTGFWRILLCEICPLRLASILLLCISKHYLYGLLGWKENIFMVMWESI